jgi:hypothetical protein
LSSISRSLVSSTNLNIAFGVSEVEAEILAI